MRFGPPISLACCTQPLSVPVPADDEGFAQRKSAWRRSTRTLKRALQLAASGQRSRLRERIDPRWRRLLWIHEGMPQIGDALMDLAPRSLLAERGIGVDLVAPPHIATLFAGDAGFQRVFDTTQPITLADYDAAIALSHDRKALRYKRERASALPWVSLQAWYGGPDFHRARFATQRLADLLGAQLSDDAFARHAAQKLTLDAAAVNDAAALLPDGPPTLALCLGGVWPERTYHRYAELVSALASGPWRRLLLLGGDNGREMADALTDIPDGLAVIDQVGRTTLKQAHALLARAAAVVCADGGLMHLALAAETPTVALFHAGIAPAWRLPPRGRAIGLQSTTGPVDAIGPADIITALSALPIR